METRANNVLVGAFVIIGITLATLFAMWIMRTTDGGPKKQFYVVFSNSVSGLAVGGAVLYNGLRVGDVSEIRINPGNPSEIRARITIDELTPVRRDTRARLVSSILTGVSSIELSGGTVAAGDLIPGPDRVPPAMFAERSFVQNIVEGGQQTLENLNRMIARGDDMLRDIQGPATNAARNIERFTQALDANSQFISTLGADLSIATRRISDLSARLETVANAVEPDRVREIIDGTARIVTTISESRDEIASTIREVNRAARGFADTAQRLEPTARRVEEIVAAVDPQAVRGAIEAVGQAGRGVARVTEAINPDQIRETVDNITSVSAALAGERERIATLIRDVSRASQNVAEATERAGPIIQRIDQILAAVDPGTVQRSVEGVERSVQQVERFAGSLGSRSDTVAKIIDDAQQLVTSLNRAAEGLGGLASGLGGGGPGGTGGPFAGVLSEFSSAAAAVRETAQNLDRRITAISGNLDRFTGAGLRDLQNLVADGRRTLGNMDRVMRDLERNPQQFIFGRSGVPEFRR